MSEDDEIGLEFAEIFQSIKKVSSRMEKRTERVAEKLGGPTGVLKYLGTMFERFEIFLKDINNLTELDQLVFRHGGTYFSPKEGDIKPIKIVQIKNRLSISSPEGYPCGIEVMIYKMWRAALGERREILEAKDE